jgi:hypothetical protein
MGGGDAEGDCESRGRSIRSNEETFTCPEIYRERKRKEWAGKCPWERKMDIRTGARGMPMNRKSRIDGSTMMIRRSREIWRNGQFRPEFIRPCASKMNYVSKNEIWMTDFKG